MGSAGYLLVTAPNQLEWLKLLRCEVGIEVDQVNDFDDVFIRRILRALDSLEYGSVNIMVHDGQITQIDRIEKQRFALSASVGKVARSGKRSNART